MEFLNFAEYDWDTWTLFFQEHWLVLLIALVVLLLIIRIVKTVVKWAIVAVVVIGVVLYSGYSMEDLKTLGTNLTDSVKQGADSLKQEAVNALVGEISDATYTDNGDGTFTIKTTTVELTGKPGEGEVSLSFRGAPLGTIQITDTIQSLIDQAKVNG